MIAYPVALVSAIPEKDIAYDNIAFLLTYELTYLDI